MRNIPASSTDAAAESDPSWWRQAVVYQIYPRSFADSDGDGIGDLLGVVSRIPYLASLGVDAIWLSPFYPSALADGGYDVDDYRDVDPRLGTLADFDRLAATLKAANIRLVIDIVPNHTSDRHSWFRDALAAGKGSPARDLYIFRDGSGPGESEPPSDWGSFFGGPCWTRVPDGQWYLHLFSPNQPDLNWANRAVRDDFLATLRFWADRGAAGFRVDVAHGLAKELSEPLPRRAELPDHEVLHGAHPFWDRDEVHDIYTEWRAVFNEYDPPRTAVAETQVHRSRRGRYASPDSLGQAFNFDLLLAAWDSRQFRTVIADHLIDARQTGVSSTWVLSNHDVVRHSTRYGLPGSTTTSAAAVANAWLRNAGTTPSLDAELGLRRARAATLLMLALPGSAYLYQGEELGLHEVADIPPAMRQDPVFHRTSGAQVGRDGCRVPLPWAAAGSSFGFGDGPAHLPPPPWFGQYAVEHQENDPISTLLLYRAALRLRRQLQGAEELTWVNDYTDSVIDFVRPGGWRSITNFGPASIDLPAGRVVLSSAPINAAILDSDVTAWIAG